jgi:hypothetical protein
MEQGFLGVLRPYEGKLVEKNFHEVMAALRILAPTLLQPTVDREVVNALWSICYFTHLWGIRPDGMLRRNGLIVSADIDRLEQWVDCINYTTAILLGLPSGGDLNEAFRPYDEMTSERK